jgi:phosphoribosyl-ATP pyrophosphohydrolase
MIANREMLRENQDLALYIFQRLDEKGITLDDFRRELDDKEESFTKLIHGKLETYISDSLFKQIELLLS